MNQLHTTQEGTTALAVPIATVAYFYTLAFVSNVLHLFEEIYLTYHIGSLCML